MPPGTEYTSAGFSTPGRRAGGISRAGGIMTQDDCLFPHATLRGVPVDYESPSTGRIDD